MNYGLFLSKSIQQQLIHLTTVDETMFFCPWVINRISMIEKSLLKIFIIYFDSSFPFILYKIGGRKKEWLPDHRLQIYTLYIQTPVCCCSCCPVHISSNQGFSHLRMVPFYCRQGGREMVTIALLSKITT